MSSLVKIGILLLLLCGSSLSAKTVLTPTVLQVDTDALSIREDFLYLRNGLNEEGVTASVGVNQLATTVNETTTHETLATMAAIKTYVDNVVLTLRADTDAQLYNKVYGGEMVGTIMFSGSIPSRDGVASTKWVFCDGSTLLISDYPELYAILGTRYGGDGTTTFGIPNMEKRMIFGTGTIGSDSFLISSPTGGSETKTLSIAEMPSHTHGISDSGHNHTVTVYRRTYMDHTSAGTDDFDMTTKGSSYSYTSSTDLTNISINNAGSGTAYNQMQPYRVIKAFIRVLP